MSQGQSGVHQAHQHRMVRDSGWFFALDVLVKIVVTLGTGVLAYMLLEIKDQGNRISVVESIIGVRVAVNDQRLTRMETALEKIDDKVDRIIERGRDAPPGTK